MTDEELFDAAKRIYLALKSAGVEIGNASIFIIRRELRPLALQARDEALEEAAAQASETTADGPDLNAYCDKIVAGIRALKKKEGE